MALDHLMFTKQPRDSRERGRKTGNHACSGEYNIKGLDCNRMAIMAQPASYCGSLYHIPKLALPLESACPVTWIPVTTVGVVKAHSGPTTSSMV